MLSVLHWAVSSGNIEAVRYLLNQGVTMTSFVPTDRLIQCKDCRTNTKCHYVDIEQLDTDPFMIAVRNKKADVVRLIDDYGCELCKSSQILSYAIECRSVDLKDYLLCNYDYQLNYGYAYKYRYCRFYSNH